LCVSVSGIVDPHPVRKPSPRGRGNRKNPPCYD
jgi:hypothetical protein